MDTKTRNGSRSFFSGIDNHIALLGLLALSASFFLLLFFQSSTSPLSGTYGADSAIFATIGRAWTQGMIPYLDTYDHKGPVVFAINALCYLFGNGRLNLFLLEVIAFAADLMLCYKISRFFVDNKFAFWNCVFFIGFFIATAEGGNLTEEWSLPFDLCVLYLALRFLHSNQPLKNHPHWYSFVYGSFFAVQLLMRLTNAINIGGIILTFIILLAAEKSWGDMLKNAVWVLAGMAVVLVPTILYFAHYGCLDELFFTSYAVNFKYGLQGAAEENPFSLSQYVMRSLVPLFGLLLAILLYKFKKIDFKVMVLTLCVGLPEMLALKIGYGYCHYWLSSAVSELLTFNLMAILIICCMQKLNWRRLSCPIFLIVAGIFLLVSYDSGTRLVVKSRGVEAMHNLEGLNLSSIKEDNMRHKRPWYDDYDQIIEQIPPQQRDDVFGYCANPDFYAYTDLLPYKHCKYFIHQQFHAQANPQIDTDIVKMMNSTPPRYIVMPEDLFNEQNVLYEFLKDEYVQVVSTPSLALYEYAGEAAD